MWDGGNGTPKKPTVRKMKRYKKEKIKLIMWNLLWTKKNMCLLTVISNLVIFVEQIKCSKWWNIINKPGINDPDNGENYLTEQVHKITAGNKKINFYIIPHYLHEYRKVCRTFTSLMKISQIFYFIVIQLITILNEEIKKNQWIRVVGQHLSYKV